MILAFYFTRYFDFEQFMLRTVTYLYAVTRLNKKTVQKIRPSVTVYFFNAIPQAVQLIWAMYGPRSFERNSEYDAKRFQNYSE